MSDAMSAEKNLKALGLTLPPVSSPVATYVNAVRTGNLLYLSGKGPLAVDGKRPCGKLGREYTIEQGYEHARTTGLDLMAVMKAELGSLDRVNRIVKVLGMVNCMPEFTDPPKVINGASDLFVAVFGEKGRHARSAVGMNSLPMGIPVEIEVIVEVGPATPRKKALKNPAAPRAAAKNAPAGKRRR